MCSTPGAYRPVLAALGQEVAAVAAAERVRLEPFDGFDPAAFTAGAPTGALARSFADMVAFNRRSAKTHSGIWRDLAVRRRRTEIDAQIGPIVAIGKEHGLRDAAYRAADRADPRHRGRPAAAGVGDAGCARRGA